MSAAKRERYHHGDLREALVTAAVDLINERGARDFSLAEVSRRLGVAPSAPYAHFADRDALLAAVAVRALELFHAELEPAPRLAEIARAYVRFASAHEALFRAVIDLDLDKSRFPEIADAEQPIEEAFRRAVSGDADGRAAAVEAVVHGHAVLLLDGRFGGGRRAIKVAADSAARSAVAVADAWIS